jgi:OmpA-OmpF porin, OOP family
MRRSSLAATASATLVLALAGAANAQEGGGFSLNRFEPAPAGDMFFAVPSPGAAGHLTLRAHAMFDHAERPVRLADTDLAVVSAQSFLRADVSLALWDSLLLSADLPLAIAQGGEDPGLTGVTFTELSAPEIGDVRLGARLRLLGQNTGPITLGLGGYLFAPTGSPEQYTSDGATRGAFHANLGGRIGSTTRFIWSASGGAEVGGANGPQLLTFGAAAGLLLAGDRLQLGAELHGTVPLGSEKLMLSSSPPRSSDAETSAEILPGAKLRVLGGLTIGAAAGTGLLKAVGAPTFRAVAMIGWAPLPEPTPEPASPQAVRVGDKDDDGIKDDIDACPDVKGVPSPDPSKDGCPPQDRDGDTVLDVEDACPRDAGIRGEDPTKNGCPTDSDGDGIFDIADACPTVRGVAGSRRENNGCPSDRDDDGIADSADVCPNDKGVQSQDPRQNGCPDDPDADGIRGAEDACPNDKGARDPDAKQNGCPRFVRVREDEIVTSKPIEFLTYGKTRTQTVAPISDDLLREVRDVILQNPDIELVEVQGHTDDEGTEAYNLTLSQERATAVLEWLVAAGVPRAKLMARGYGYERPLADNRVRTGRQKNRRVQFMITKRKR